jgi:hypothetical protein
MKMESFEKLWAPIFVILGAVVFIRNFFDVLNGGKASITFAFIFVSLIAIIAGMWRFAFAKSDKPFEKNGKFGFLPKYKYHLAAKAGLAVAICLLLVLIYYIITFFEFIPDCCGIVSTKTPAATATPVVTTTLATMPTLTYTPTQTLTPTDTPTPTAVPDYFITDCITSGVWEFSYKGAIISTKPDEDSDLNCLELEKFYFSAPKKGPTGIEDGLWINPIFNTANAYGVYYPFTGDAEFNIDLDINKLKSDVECRDNSKKGYCDVDLIIGLGDPINDKYGDFIAIRSATNDNNIYICHLNWFAAECDGKNYITEKGMISGEKPLRIEISFNVIGYQDYIKVKIGTSNYDLGQHTLSATDKQLWIGYKFTNAGAIDALIQFK